MADVITKLNSLINPQVMADIVRAKLEKRIAVMPYAKLDATLEGQAGSTITVPKFEYIGDAVDVAEGEDIPARELKCVGTPHAVKKVGIGGTLTDEAVLSGYGNPVGELSNQMGNAIASKCDADCMGELYTAKTSYKSTKVMSYESIVNAIDAFEEEENSEKVVFVHPKQVTQLRLDPNFISKEKYNNEVIATGEIGTVANAHVVPSKKVMLAEYEVTTVSSGNTQITSDNLATYESKTFPKPKVGDYVKAVEAKYYVNPIVKLVSNETDDESPALTIFVKRDTNIETERKSKNRTTEVTGDKVYVVALTNDSKVVNLKSLQVPTV